MVCNGASMFVPCFWSPNTAKNSRFGGITAPCASRGIDTLPNLASGILKPNVLPPIPGTQSGTSKLILLSPLTIQFIIFSNIPIMPLIANSKPFISPFPAIFARSSQNFRVQTFAIFAFQYDFISFQVFLMLSRRLYHKAGFSPFPRLEIESIIKAKPKAVPTPVNKRIIPKTKPPYAEIHSLTSSKALLIRSFMESQFATIGATTAPTPRTINPIPRGKNGVKQSNIPSTIAIAPPRASQPPKEPCNCSFMPSQFNATGVTILAAPTAISPIPHTHC